MSSLQLKLRHDPQGPTGVLPALAPSLLSDAHLRLAPALYPDDLIAGLPDHAPVSHFCRTSTFSLFCLSLYCPCQNDLVYSITYLLFISLALVRKLHNESNLAVLFTALSSNST